MRILPVVLLVAILAGCASAPAPPSSTSEAPIPPSDLPGTLNTTTEDGVQQTYAFSLTNMTFVNQVERIRFTANGNASYDFRFSGAIPAVSAGVVCLGIEAHKVFANGTFAAAAGILGVASDSNVYAEARVMGQRVPVLGDQFEPQPGVTQPIEGRLAGQLKAGDQVVVEVAGTDHQVLAQNGGSLSGQLVVNGTGTFEALPLTAVSCGAGLRELEGSTGVNTYLVTTAVGGSVTLPVAQGGLMLIQALSLVDQTQVGTYTFLNETDDIPTELVRTKLGAGRLGLDFESWVGFAGSPKWFFADTFWPAFA
ncbi:MAG: hypothetical protein AABX89_02330 [Candidatus Thermoplasmatota archaeon]